MKKMKKRILSVCLVAITSISVAQDAPVKTLFKKSDKVKTDKPEKSIGGYGAPFVGVTSLDNDLAIMVGAKGGVIVNHKFGFGGIGGATISTENKNFTAASLTNSTEENQKTTNNLTLGYGGVFFEYIIGYDKPVHVSLPLNIMAGGVNAGLAGDSLTTETSAVMVIEPGINLEFNFTSFFVPALNLGYRFVTGPYAKELSGVYGTLQFKFGKY